MSESEQWVLAERPKGGHIVPGQTFHRESKPIPKPEDLNDGQLIVENWYLALDPAMRGWLNDARSYVKPVQIGDTMRGMTVSRVVASKSPKASKGDVITCYGGWAEYALIDDATVQPSSLLPAVSKPSHYLSLLGVTGMTAYFGMTKIGDPQPGDTVVISSAAGATGSVAGQIAKIKGARVVGLAGSDEKCEWIKNDLGFDEALNYKDPDFKSKFEAATPDFIDVYYDNVGGEILDMALGRAKEHARFISCGMISLYNATKPYALKNISNIVTMRIKMQGFIVLDHIPEFPAAQKQLAQWNSEGKLKTMETVVQGGIEVVEKSFTGLFEGTNTGKLIVEIKKPEEASKL